MYITGCKPPSHLLHPNVAQMLCKKPRNVSQTAGRRPFPAPKGCSMCVLPLNNVKNTKQFLGAEEPQTWKGPGPERVAVTGPGTSGGDRTVAVFGGVGVVSSTRVQEDLAADRSLVSGQGVSEFSRRVGRSATRSVASTNYYHVRKTYRNCQNYRILNRRASSSSVINIQKRESSPYSEV